MVRFAPIGSSTTEMRENINETIDASVFERWRDDNNYRPPNIKEWALRRAVDPNVISGSISADTLAAIL
jgi:hypothetical protein